MVSVQVLCASCDIPSYSDLEEDMTYSVLLNDFLIAGGDGYDMIAGNMLYNLPLGKPHALINSFCPVQAMLYN